MSQNYPKKQSLIQAGREKAIKILKKKEAMTWKVYLKLLETRAESNWFSGTWKSHACKVNYAICTFDESVKKIPIKNEIDREIVKSLIFKMMKADGRIKKEKIKQLSILGLKFQEEPVDAIKPKALQRKIKDFQKQNFIFYELMKMALADNELHPNEFELLCELSENLQITQHILHFSHIWKNKVWQHRSNGRSPFRTIEENISKIENDLTSTTNQTCFKTMSQEKLTFWIDTFSNTAERLVFFGCSKTICNRMRSIASALQNGSLKLGLIGVTSSGKTALMNALIGEKLLPEGTKPTTNVAVYVRRSEQRRGIVTYENGQQQVWSGESLKNELHTATNEAKNSNNHLNIETITLEHPDFLLPPHLELLDTPGLNALGHEEHAEITMEKVLPHLDMVIYLNTISNLLKREDMKFIELARKHLSSDQKILFVITGKGKEKGDQHTPLRDKWNAQISRLRTELDSQGLTKDSTSIVLIDSKWAQWGRLGYLKAWKESELPEMFHKLSQCTVYLQQNLLELQISHAIRILDNEVRQPLQTRHSASEKKRKETIREGEARQEELIKASLLIFEASRNFESTIKGYNNLKNPSKPISESDFNLKASSLKTTSFSIMRKIQDEYYAYRKSCINQFNALGVRYLTRKEIDIHKIQVDNKPSVRKTAKKVNKKGVISWFKRLVHVGGKETVYEFDPAASHIALQGYYNQLSEVIQSLIHDCTESIEVQFHNPLDEGIDSLKDQIESLKKERSETDIVFIQYLDETLSEWKPEITLLKQARKNRPKQSDHVVEDDTPEYEFSTLNLLPQFWQSHGIHADGFIFTGGKRKQHTAWYEYMYQQQLHCDDNTDSPLWFGNLCHDFSNDYSSLPCRSGEIPKYFLSMPESLNQSSKLPDTVVKAVISQNNWMIGVHLDINRIGSGLSDVQNTLKDHLEKLAAARKVFFWNLDMAYFDRTERLFEFITGVNDILNEPLYRNVHWFFGEGGDIRWTYLLHLAHYWKKYKASWEKYKAEDSFFSIAWQSNKFSIDPPFIPSVLKELDQLYHAHLENEVGS